MAFACLEPYDTSLIRTGCRMPSRTKEQLLPAQEKTMKILVGYDGSNSAKAALKLARKHALAFGASVDVITSMEKGTEGEQQAIEDAERGLEWAMSMFAEKDVACKTHLLIRGMAPGE